MKDNAASKLFLIRTNIAHAGPHADTRPFRLARHALFSYDGRYRHRVLKSDHPGRDVLEHCRTEEDYRKLLDSSSKQPVFLLKHSTTCGISAMAREDYRAFDDKADGCQCWELTVQASRSLSSLIAEETGVRHESPQVFLYRDGNVAWHTSHGQIRLERLREALADASS
jgi:bacillithiol system protein YtxJ